jgi:hypothetical protein
MTETFRREPDLIPGLLCLVVLAALALMPTPTEAHITRIQIVFTESPLSRL